MNHRVSALSLSVVAALAAAGALLGLSACADDDVIPVVRVDGGADGASPSDASHVDAADAATPVDGAPPVDDSALPPVDSGADTSVPRSDAGDGGDAGGDASTPDASSSDASDASTADAALTCLPSGVITIVSQGSSSYAVNGVDNAPLTLCRGRVYTFGIVASGHPFYIKTIRGSGTANGYSDGVVPNNGIEVGNLTFTVPATAPTNLFYDCSVHSGMSGPITVIDP